LPPGARARLGKLRPAHDSLGVYAALFLPDGKTAVSAGYDAVRVWDLASGRELRHFGPPGGACALALAADGKTLAAASTGVSLWDVTTGREIRQLEPSAGGPGGVARVAFSPDGKTLAAATYPARLRLWDAATGRLLRELSGHRRQIYALAYAPDGKALAAGDDAGVHLWDPAAGKEVRTIPHEPDRFAQPHLQAVAFSPDGRLLAVGTWHRTVRLWDTTTWQEVRRLGPHPGGILSLTFAPDGKALLAGGYDKTLCLWDVATGKVRRQMSEPIDLHAWATAFAPDGKTLLATSLWTLYVLDAAGGREVLPFGGHRVSVQALAYSGDGTVLASKGGDGTVRLWDVATGRERGRIAVHPANRYDASLGLTPDGKTVLTGDGRGGSVLFWDAAAGREVRRLGVPGPFVLSPDGRALAYPRSRAAVVVCDAATGKDLHRFETKKPGWRSALAFSADGTRLAAGSHEDGQGAVYVWDLAAGKELRRLGVGADWISSVVLSPDGKLVAAHLEWVHPKVPDSRERTLAVWSVATGKEYWHIREDQEGGEGALAFSPDGRALAWGDGNRLLRVLEVASGKERRRFAGHRGRILAVAFGPDGRSVASAGQDATILLWDLTGR
jgi:WD40 repeat protein